MPAPSTGPVEGHKWTARASRGSWAVYRGDNRLLTVSSAVVTQEAVAKLAAAAPALLEAAKRLKAIHDDLSARIDQGEDTDDAFDLWDEGVTELGAAIALAEGSRP